MPEKFIVYGRRQVVGATLARPRLDTANAVVGIRTPGVVEGVHADFDTYEAAYEAYFSTKALIRQARVGTTLHAVIVKLINGRDLNGEREVVFRIGDGKAWWE
jgi:hypothetical protein